MHELRSLYEVMCDKNETSVAAPHAVGHTEQDQPQCPDGMLTSI